MDQNVSSHNSIDGEPFRYIPESHHQSIISRREFLEDLIGTLGRRLGKLELRRARLGSETPVSIEMEIEDIGIKLKQHKQELSKLTRDYSGISTMEATISIDKRMLIKFQGDFSDAPPELIDLGLKAFSAVTGIVDIDVRNIRDGCIEFDMILSLDGIERLGDLIQTNNEQLHQFKVEKVLLESVRGDVHEWIVRRGEFCFTDVSYGLQESFLQTSKLRRAVYEEVEYVLQCPIRLAYVCQQMTDKNLREIYSVFSELGYDIDNLSISNDIIERILINSGSRLQALGSFWELSLFEQGIIWLHYASASGKEGRVQDTWIFASRAYEYLPEGSDIWRIITLLILGDVYNHRDVEWLNKEDYYYEAIWCLDRAEYRESEKGNHKYVEIFRMLKEELRRRVVNIYNKRGGTEYFFSKIVTFWSLSMNRSYHVLVDKIREKLDYKKSLSDLEWCLLRSPDDRQLQEIIRQQKLEYDDLDRQVIEEIQKVFIIPLLLIAMPRSRRPYLQRLNKAGLMINELVANPENKEVRGILNEIKRANDLLKLDSAAVQFDWALVYLFIGTALQIKGDYSAALDFVNKAANNISERENFCLVITRLLQAKIYSENVSGRMIEGQNAYEDAAVRLEKLQQIEAEQGNRARAELFRLLKERVEKELDQSRVWK